MKVLGLTMGQTSTGKPLKDGSLAWYRSDKNILIVSEEQAANRKHAGGFEASLQKFYQGNRSRPDLVAVSSCCEPMITDVSGLEAQFGCNVQVVNHHLSHAHQAAWTVGYRDALILVLDAGGNVLEPFDERGPNWWRYKREQLSIFECVAGRVTLIDRQFCEPFDIGLGEFWRYMTYACGFDTSTKASKVMELAAFDDPSENPISALFYSGGFCSGLRNDPPNKQLVKNEILKHNSLADVEARKVPLVLAGWAQRSLEEAVTDIVNQYQSQLDHQLLCISGGVALNCKLVQSLREQTTFDDISVGFCPSDKGQSLGNCLAVQTKRRKVNSYALRNPFLGTKRTAPVGEIRSRLGQKHHTHIVETGVKASAVLNLIDEGFIVATWCGRGEVGARALGNSSILANPLLPNIKERLNRKKDRPIDTPIAPAFSKECFEDHFEEANENFAFMAETVCAQRDGKSLSSSMKHIDGSIRPQVIDEEAESYLAKLLPEEGSARRKNFALLNTSFNGPGRPMAGTLDQAVSEFLELELDALCCPNDTLVRRKNARLEAALDADDPNKFFFRDYQDFQEKAESCGINSEVELRERFLLFDNYIRWAAEGRKVTTIRFKQNALSIAGPVRLPLVETKDFKQSAMDVQKLEVEVLGFTVKKFRQLDQVDAQRDGFEKTSHLKQTLRNIYPQMNDDDLVTINFIKIVPRGQ